MGILATICKQISTSKETRRGLNSRDNYYRENNKILNHLLSYSDHIYGSLQMVDVIAVRMGIASALITLKLDLLLVPMYTFDLELVCILF